MIVYVYNKCSTCQNAVRFLQAKNIEYVRREITETPPSVQELQTMLKYANGNLKKLFNSSGQLYREMQLTEKLKTLSQSDALTLLSQHGMLVKRPFLLGNNFGLTGFNEVEWSKKI
jgi:arsenate reductase (glutaredoxin)